MDLRTHRIELNDARDAYRTMRNRVGVLTSRLNRKGLEPNYRAALERWRSKTFGQMNRARVRLRQAIKQVELGLGLRSAI